MSDQVQPDDGSSRPAQPPGRESEQQALLATRRRLILKTLGKGSAILAAATPIKTLAATPSVTSTGQICSISGVQSAAHSQPSTAVRCGSYTPGYYKMRSHWPNYSSSNTNPSYTVTCLSRGTIGFNRDTAFSAVFGGGLTNSLIDILKNHENSAEFHWIGALLSAIAAPPGYVYPYSPGELIDLYNSAQQAAALNFIKTVMEGAGQAV